MMAATRSAAATFLDRSFLLGASGRDSRVPAATQSRRQPGLADVYGCTVDARHPSAMAGRERSAEYLLTVRLEQLREQTADQTETAAPAPWVDRLSELAARPLDGEMAGVVIA